MHRKMLILIILILVFSPTAGNALKQWEAKIDPLTGKYYLIGVSSEQSPLILVNYFCQSDNLSPLHFTIGAGEQLKQETVKLTLDDKLLTYRPEVRDYGYNMYFSRRDSEELKTLFKKHDKFRIEFSTYSSLQVAEVSLRGFAQALAKCQ